MDQKQVDHKYLNGEPFVQNLLDQVPVYIAYVDINLVYRYVSKAYANWFGLSQDQLIGKQVNETFNETIYTSIFYHIKEVLNGKTVSFETEVTKPDYTQLHVLSTYIPYYNIHNEIIAFIAFMRDVTDVNIAINECKLSEQMAIEKKDELDRFFNVNLDMLCIADLNGYFLKLNPEWERTLGYSQGELVGKYFFDLVHPDDKANTYKALKDLMGNRSVINFVNRYQCKDGSYRWIEWRSKPCDNKIYAAARDITQRIEYEKDIERNDKLLRELNLTKDKLFSIVAHDLKSPFTAILGYTELLHQSLNNISKDEFASIINDLYVSSKSAFDLLENLLDWSRMQTGAFRYYPKNHLFEELVEQSVSTISSLASTKDIIIETNYPKNVWVYADCNLTNSILRNLLTNAIKFSYIKSKISVNAIVVDNEIQISVIDKGIGIRSEIQKNLFNIETQESSPGTLNEKGTGLGLILCKDFVEKQGGKIWVESEPGKGSMFSFTLPLQNEGI